MCSLNNSIAKKPSQIKYIFSFIGIGTICYPHPLFLVLLNNDSNMHTRKMVDQVLMSFVYAAYQVHKYR